MSAYIVGIDLGTTHTVVAYAPAKAPAVGGRRDPAVRDRAAGRARRGRRAAAAAVVALPPGAGRAGRGRSERCPGRRRAGDDAVIGELARQLGAQVPGRLVASAKSWLSHAAVDRLAPILPWGAPTDVPKVSPVAASASYLAHLRAAWNHRFPQAPLEEQEVVLTVPASFDEAARALTLEAARERRPAARCACSRSRRRRSTTGCSAIARSLAAELADTRLVLVCDVGGGTTDLSLVRVEMHGGEPRLERIAVGHHLMLGGDNMDLALAHLAEAQAGGGTEAAARLSAGAAVAAGRALPRRQGAAARAPTRRTSATVTLLGAGSRLIGGARSVELAPRRSRTHRRRRLLPAGSGRRAAAPRTRERGLVAFGLPYASDPAVTRHLAAFLQQHARCRLARRAAAQRRRVPRRGDRRALARDAGRAGAARRCSRCTTPTRTSRSRAAPSPTRWRGAAWRRRSAAARRAATSCCSTAAERSERARRLRAAARQRRGTRGAARRPQLRAARAASRCASTSSRRPPTRPAQRPQAGELVDLAEQDAQPLPPLATVVRTRRCDAARREIAGASGGDADRGRARSTCIASPTTTRRSAGSSSSSCAATAPVAAAPAGLPPRFAEAVALIERVFGARDRHADPKAVKQLRTQLEALLGSRERWTTALLRALFDALLAARARPPPLGRPRAAVAEPGRLVPAAGLRRRARRLAHRTAVADLRAGRAARPRRAGLRRMVDAVAPRRRRPGRRGAAAAARRLRDQPARRRDAGRCDARRGWSRAAGTTWCGSARRSNALPTEHKVEIGDWLVEQLQRAGREGSERDTWTLWAIGRLGARAALSTAARTASCRPTPPPRGSTPCSRWTGSGSKARPPRPRISRA